MQTTIKKLDDTKIQLKLIADQGLLDMAKNQALREAARGLRLPGFRQGKAPLQLVEKNANQAALQSDFLDRAMNQMYATAIAEETIRPVSQPQVNVTKFVPYSTLELEIEVDVIGDVKLPDYKNVKLDKPAVKITAKDIDETIKQLQTRDAERKDVDRAAKDGDQVTIDFKGVDAKTKEAINGADGDNYPLALGSNTFIPGFEPELVGLKAGDEKTFDITFPKDYGVSSLQGKKVTFTVNVKKVAEMVLPKADDEFAAKVGPFKSLADLKEDIKKQLESEKQYQADRDFESQLLELLTDQATIKVPASLIDQELDRLEQDERQNLMYRGQTWEEHLKAEGVTEEEHRERKRADAEKRVKAGLLLAEISEAEKVEITPDELAVRMQVLKGQYTDKAMQAELDKPENQREIASRLLTEKTVEKLVAYASGK